MRSILSRKRDAVYLLFFLIHIPIMLCIDLVPLYPQAFVPQALLNIRDWYISTYQDRFFIDPPSWFHIYIYLEAIYHFPASVWTVGALWRDDPKVPLHLLVFGLETSITTLTCLTEMLGWQDFSLEQKTQLSYMYGPYLALAVFMSVDMYGRLHGMIERRTKFVKTKSN